MPDTYEISCTIGVRQANMGPATFQASETIILTATGFTDLMDILSLIHKVISQLRLRHGEPQDQDSGSHQIGKPGRP